MNCTWIEKIKDFLYLGAYREGEEEGFGIIKVFPYLCPENLEKTKERAIRESHHLQCYRYKINVRSRDAVEDIGRVLDRHGFVYWTKNETERQIRQWFSTESDLLEYLVYDESTIVVEVDEDDLENFVKMIKVLRQSHSYRNIYQDENETFYIV